MVFILWVLGVQESPDLFCVTSGDSREVDEFLLELRFCEAHDDEHTV